MPDDTAPMPSPDQSDRGLWARIVDAKDHSTDPVVVLSFSAVAAMFAFQAFVLIVAAFGVKPGEMAQAVNSSWSPAALGGGVAAILAPMVPGLFRKFGG